MTDYSVDVIELVKFFGRRLIFNGINFKFASGNIYGVSGPNGSGKSTFVKIVADLISPTRGNIIHKVQNKMIEAERLHNYMGFVSPYLCLYDEFTAEENLIHFSNIRGINFQRDKAEFLLNEVNLFERRNDPVRGYSSGMKQRLKFIFALLHNPLLLIFDEPTSNLDTAGKDKVYRLILQEGKDKTVIIASNENADLALCKEIIELEKFKNSSYK